MSMRRSIWQSLRLYYEIGERKEVKLLQGSIVYYELTRK